MPPCPFPLRPRPPRRSRTTPGCSTWATGTRSTGRCAAIRAASPRWWCTAGPVRGVRPGRRAPSTSAGTASSSSTSATAGAAPRTPPNPSVSLLHNTTDHLVADMERLRHHLGIGRWLLYGASWGSTLLLAYAVRHPERVTEIVVPSVTTTRRSEIDWLYRGVGRFFPEAWDRFVTGSGTGPDGDLVGAYARLVDDPDPAVRTRAVADWLAWEDAVVSAEGMGAPYAARPAAGQTAMVRICTWYFSHGAWLEEGALIRDAHRLGPLPGELVHGRLDLGGPVHTAWELARNWPGARLSVVESAGHLGGAETLRLVRAATDRFAD
ncbi:alpha/beta fold hydrolase [Streptomyces fungicidicus]|uniref:Alpha/beta fold hydrolase n=1 Tax=Streptomyces fungicidicus TaxID=68203 RepID=A0ACC7XV32_9ACTN|nr:alpha/beta fold hydrolase [Streptomyces fungicidicus]NUV73349.1 alpha/beta fold hydrolase [Streptomyces fungicidicus]